MKWILRAAPPWRGAKRFSRPNRPRDSQTLHLRCTSETRDSCILKVCAVNAFYTVPTVLHMATNQLLPAPWTSSVDTEQNMLIRRTDWRFLLPSPSGGAFEHLVLLGGPEGLPELVVTMGIAQRVSTDIPHARSADAVVRFVDSPTDLRTAAGCLLSGGALYFEVDREGPSGRVLTPRRARRELRHAGLSEMGLYWARNDLINCHALLPIDSPAAVAWYTANVRDDYVTPTLRARLATLFDRAFAYLGLRPPALRLRYYVITAVFGENARPPSVFSAAGAPADLRKPGLNSIVLTPRLRRVVFLPFSNHDPNPLGVVKVARYSHRNAAARNEYKVLEHFNERLDERLRNTVPQPRAFYDWCGLSVEVETCIRGSPLGSSNLLRGRAVSRTHFENLSYLTRWLCDFHTQMQVRSGSWDEFWARELEAVLASYERAVGLTADEKRLFAAVRSASKALLGNPLPILWTHGDLNLRNTRRTSNGVGVYDWETAKEGLPVLDLLHFLEVWIHAGPVWRERGSRTTAAQIHRFDRVFVQAPLEDPYTAAAHDAISQYMSHLRLDRRLYPVLLVLHWVTRFVTWTKQRSDPDTDEIRQQMGARYQGYIRALAAGTEQIFSTRIPSVS
jgi:hypothetical protein